MKVEPLCVDEGKHMFLNDEMMKMMIRSSCTLHNVLACHVTSNVHYIIFMNGFAFDVVVQTQIFLKGFHA